MSVTREEVAKIAALARIRMDEDALDHMVPEFNAILAWVEQLGEVDTSAVEPMTAVIDQKLRLREDGSLEVKGCVAFFCRTRVWTRAD